MRVGQPIDMNNGFELMSERGRAATWQIIESQQPTVMFMAPVCTPWSLLHNAQDQTEVQRNIQLHLPMASFCVDIARYQHDAGILVVW